MNNIKFLYAERTSPNDVRVNYQIGRHRFCVQWSNICPVTGKETAYNLEETAISSNSELEELLNEAISKGESDDNLYLDAYLFIRDTFDYHDCAELETVATNGVMVSVHKEELLSLILLASSANSDKAAALADRLLRVKPTAVFKKGAEQ